MDHFTVGPNKSNKSNKLAPLVLLATGKLPVAALRVFGRPHFLNQLSIGVTTDGLAHFPSKTYNVSIFLIGP